MYRMVAMENTGPSQMWRWQEGDPVTVVGGFDVQGASIEEALECLWVVGNREGVDENGRSWPSDHRSMCTGDLVLVTDWDGGLTPSVWACDHFGWTPLDQYLAADKPRKVHYHDADPHMACVRDDEGQEVSRAV